MKDYKDFAIDLALVAGKIIKDNFILGVSRAWKADDTPITVTDKEINNLVLKTIKNNYPEHSILSEEGSDLRESDYVWVCDPIDGTVPFSHGVPISVFTIALTYKGEVVLGVIYDPYMDRMVVGEKGKGAYLNNRRINVSNVDSIKNTVVDVETWKSALYDLTPLFGPLIEKGSMASTFRSSVYSGMLIGMGEFSGMIFGGKTAWDGAAVKIIVEEAGGKVTDLFGNDQLYNTEINGFVASNGKVHKYLLDLIQLHITPKKV